jgi:hypothetical protein
VRDGGLRDGGWVRAGRGAPTAPVRLRDAVVGAAAVIGPLAAAGPIGVAVGVHAGRRDAGR